MAPMKSKVRAVVAHSDFESDNPAQEAMPVTELRRYDNTNDLNHSVLRRYVPSLNAILSIASFCVLYAFNPVNQAWEKLGVDGSLFVNSLTPDADGVARFNIVVLNRRGTDPNAFTIEIKTANDVELTDEYIILQDQAEDGSLKIYGLWIFTEPHPSSTAMAREINGQMIKQCAMMADTSRKIAMQNAQSSDEEPQSVAMGRQLSLRELFGKQREADADFSIHHHDPVLAAPAASTPPAIPNIGHDNMSAQAQAQAVPQRQTPVQPKHKQVSQRASSSSTPTFVNSDDTNFFLAPKVTQTQRRPPHFQHSKQESPALSSPALGSPSPASGASAQEAIDFESMTAGDFFDVARNAHKGSHNGP